MAFLNKTIQDGDNADLTEERKTATFDSDKMASIIYGSEKLVARRRQITDTISRMPELKDSKPFPYMTREEKITEACRKLGVLSGNWNEFIDVNEEEEALHFYREVMGLEGHPLALHETMFIPSLISQASDEQQEKWLGRARRREIIGCYAQTELGHGTNLRKLETTATYDQLTQEFILHTPTVTALKWWPGALGKSANYAVVVANITINDHNYGPHPFMVQLRNDDHIPLPGITVGDIGPKMAFNGADNGYLGFSNVRIPRGNLLNRHSRVEVDGTYVKPPHAKIGYSSMVKVRSRMAMDQGLFLASALVIAVRYSAVRRQGFLEDKSHEVKVLDYQTQQYRLFPSIARAYAFIFCGFETIRLYDQLILDMNKHGNTAGMTDLHALTSGLKSVVTHFVGQGIEQARMACGGHGYSMASYISEIYGVAIAGCTYEGENIVMLLQSAKSIVKSIELLKNGDKLGPMVAYLAKSDIQVELNSGPEAYIKMFQMISKRQAFKATEKLNRFMDRGDSRDLAWNKTAVEFTRVSRLQTRLYIMEAFARRVSSIEDVQIKKVLSDLLDLHLNYELLDVSTYALEYGFISSSQLDYIKNKLYSSMEAIRPNAVSLMDSFQFSDMQLRSILGRRDGHVYSNLFEWAKSSPLNKTDVLPSVHRYLKPMMEKAKL